jgi:hypothetical protein
MRKLTPLGCLSCAEIPSGAKVSSQHAVDVGINLIDTAPVQPRVSTLGTIQANVSSAWAREILPIADILLLLPGYTVLNSCPALAWVSQ